MDTLKRVTTDWVTFSELGYDYVARFTYGFDVSFAEKHNQSPHFSITGETYRKRRQGERFHRAEFRTINGVQYVEDSFGQLRDTLAKRFPELMPLQVWHLTSIDSGPMHYLANGLYHLGNKAEAYFKSTVCYGMVPADSIVWEYPPYDLARAGMERRKRALQAFQSSRSTETRIELAEAEKYVSGLMWAIRQSLREAEAYLIERLPILLKRFRADMISHGLIVETETKSESER